MLSVIVSGVVTGLLYALAGQGLVVVYRTTKVLNFALGGMGVVVAYLAYELLQQGVPYWLVLPVAVLVGAILGGLIEILIIRPLRHRPPLTISIATMGALLIFEGAAGQIWGNRATALRPFLESAGTLRFGAALALSANQILIVGVGVVGTIGLLLMVGRTKLGLSMRATTSGPMTSELLGVNVARVRLAGWMIGGGYGCLAAMLVIPLTYLSPTSFTTFMLTAFSAVALGGFTSILGVVIGAIVFGVGTNLLMVYLQSGLIATYTFIGAAVVLVFRPHGIFGKQEREVAEPAVSSRALSGAQARSIAHAGQIASNGTSSTSSRRLPPKVVGCLCLAVALAIGPYVLGTSNLYLVATILATFVGVLGLNIITGYTGQASLGNSGFAAVGAYTAAYAAAHGVPFLLALVLAGVAGGLVGLVIGVVATRLSGLYLALLTLLFAFAVPEIVSHLTSVTGGLNGMPMATGSFGSPRAMYWLVYVIALIAAAGVMFAAATRIGRNWRAVRDSENGARAFGLNPARIKLTAFFISSALVGVGGALLGLLTLYVSPASFDVFLGVYALLAVILGGSGSVIGSLVGSAFIVWVPRHTGDLPVPLVFGLALLLVMLAAPMGIAGLAERASNWTLTRLRRPRHDEAPSRSASTVLVGSPRRTPVEPAADGRQPVLELTSVAAGYGVGDVLRDVSITVHKGEVVTLLGANGAGKSTVLRVISGLVPTTHGEIRWLGDQIGLSPLRRPHEIARRGIAHVPEGRGIFPDLTVRENLRLGLFARGDREGFEDDLERVFTYFPRLRERAKQLAGTMSGGEQQMLAVGRALMGRPKLLMLDEPSLGLSPLMSQLVFDTLRTIADEGDVAVLLIEQNARAALELADRGYVLARGKVVASGSAAELNANERLSDHYLAVQS